MTNEAKTRAARGEGHLYVPKYAPRGKTLAEATADGTLRFASCWWFKWSCLLDGFRTCRQTACTGWHHESTGARVVHGETAAPPPAAVKFKRLKIKEVESGQLHTKQMERQTFEDLAARLVTRYTNDGKKSLERLEDSITHLRAFFGAYRARAIDYDAAGQYIEHRRAEGAAPATIKVEMTHLGQMFREAAKANTTAAVPVFPSVKVQNTRQGFFEPDEVARVLAHLPDEIAPLVAFYYDSGWRTQEILGLKWAQVNFRAGEVRLEPGSTKNADARVLHFSTFPRLADLLTRQRERADAVQRATGVLCPFVFFRYSQRAQKPKPIRNFYKAWHRACRAAGVPGKIPHDFRRTMVKRLEAARIPRATAMSITGHRSESVYRRYHIVSPAEQRDAMAKLDEQQRAEQPKAQVVTFMDRKRAGR
jgi:integrase